MARKKEGEKNWARKNGGGIDAGTGAGVKLQQALFEGVFFA